MFLSKLAFELFLNLNVKIFTFVTLALFVYDSQVYEKYFKLVSVLIKLLFLT